MKSSGSKILMKVIVLIGVISFNINSLTIYSTLSIPIINKKSLDLDDKRLKQL